jgi:tetratricopeptide (TPR) repeat protein
MRTDRLVLAVAVSGLAIGLAGGLAGCEGAGGGGGETRDLRSPGRMQVDANRAYLRGDYETALADYQAIVDRRPGSARAHYDLGRTLLEVDQPMRAREHLTVAHDIEPENQAYLDALADAMLQSGEIDELFGLLERRAEEGDGPAGYLRLGRAAQRLGLVDEAETAYKQAAALEPQSSAPAQRALAGLYRQIGDEAKELTRLRVLLYLEPKDEAVQDRIVELGEIPGPSLALPPESAG